MNAENIILLVLVVVFVALWLVEAHVRLGAQNEARRLRREVDDRTGANRILEDKIEFLEDRIEQFKDLDRGRAKWAAQAVVERKKLEDELERIGEELNHTRDRYRVQVERTAKADRFLARLIQGASDVRNKL